MSDSELKAGEIALGCVSVDGCRSYARAADDGSVERGLIVPVDHPLAARADFFVRAGEEIRPGVRRVEQRIVYTAKGPARVASDAYRSGWDGVFGRSETGGDGCKVHRAN